MWPSGQSAEFVIQRSWVPLPLDYKGLIKGGAPGKLAGCEDGFLPTWLGPVQTSSYRCVELNCTIVALPDYGATLDSNVELQSR